MIAPLVLHDADAEVTAALALRATRHLLVHATGERAARLAAAGFLRAPHWIEIAAPAPFDLSQLSRNSRKAIDRSLRAWHAAGLEVTLDTASGFGLERLVREIYYPIVVPYVDARGINPHGIHRVHSFVALAKQSVLAIVSANDAIVGLALLKITDLNGALHVGGAPLAGRGMEGLVYALRPELAECRRALMVALAQAVAEAGGSFLSLGKDHPWAEPQYAAVLRQKLGLADSIYVHDGDLGHFYHWKPLGPDEALWFAPYAGGAIEHRALGMPVLGEWIDRINRATTTALRGAA
jgi:hypothetical protein